MVNDPMPDCDVEQNVVFEYSQAMAAAAESGLRYPDRMQNARSEAERAFIRESYAKLVKKTIDAHRIAFAAITLNPYQPKGHVMPNWIKLVIAGLGTAGVVAGTIASGGTLAVAIALGASSATGTLAGFFHPSPSAK